MKSVAGIAAIFGGFLATGAAVAMLPAGCSDDSSAATPDGGPDVTTHDSAVGMDSSSPADAAGDARDAADSSAATDGGDASDSSDFSDIGDVQINAPTLAQYPNAIDQAYCTRLQQCCLVPGNEWNQAGTNGCVPLLDSFGSVFGIANYSAAFDSGLVTYNSSVAVSCLHSLLSFNCGTISTASINGVSAECYSAIGGLVADGGACTSSLECSSGQYCRVLGDAGACAPLGTQGQPCKDTVGSSDCSYLGNGVPPLYCGATDAGASCQASLPDDAGCSYNPQCQSQSCADLTCIGTYVFSDPGNPKGTCADFTIKDAGAGE